MQSETGQRGEDCATKYLESYGYKICERNFRTPFGELDIVCRKENVIIFVEVKTLKENASGFTPELHFTENKMQKMQRTIRAYLKDRLVIGIDYQLDLVAVELKGNSEVKDIRHYENITM